MVELVDTRDSKIPFRKKVSVRVRSVVLRILSPAFKALRMRKTYVCGVGNALIDSEYRVSDNELAKLNLTKGCTGT